MIRLRQLHCLSELFALLVLVLFFLGPFYWPGSNAAWTNTLRIGAALGFLLLLFRDWPLRRPDSFQIIFFIFGSYLVLNALFLAADNQSFRRLVFLLCFVLMISRIGLGSSGWNKLIAFLAVLGAGFASFSIANLYRLGELILEYRSDSIFSSGFPGMADFGNTIVASLYYAACFCAAVWMFFSARNNRVLLFWGGCAAVTGCYVVLTYSRTGWVACLVGGAALWFLLFERLKWKRFAFSAFVVLMAGVFFLFKYSAYEFGVRGVTHRDEIWYSVLAQALPSWLWGKGAGVGVEPIIISGGAQTVHNTHSLYLEIYYQFGIVGFLLAMTALFTALIRLWRLAKHGPGKDVSSFAFALLSAVTVVMCVELNSFVSSPNLVWLWFWLPLGIALSSMRRAHA